MRKMNPKRHVRFCLWIGFLLMFFFDMAAAGTAPIEPVPYRVAAKMKDAAEMPRPWDVHIDGWIGHRIDINEKNRLLTVDTVPLLAGFHEKPGSHPWIGEHIGKWLHAATLAWAYTGDPALKAKLDAVAAELISCQEPDGYLGTYIPEQRFGRFGNIFWDVWSHRYNMIGLLTYYEYTGNEAALDCCRKMGDLLARTFPAQKSILAAGGYSSTTVLESIVMLYRFTGEQRYLDFAKYIVSTWDEEGTNRGDAGPRYISGLLEHGDTSKVGGGKAYQEMSNFLGLCELARVTGDRSYLEPVLIAWNDIVKNRLYITGTGSSNELFQGEHELPNSMSYDVGECCVTTTWIQLNWQLLRLTGDAKYGNEIDRAVYNHLAAAQSPNGSDWCYYTGLEGHKPYDKGITCCHSSGPRAMALAPLTAYWKMPRFLHADTLAVSTLESSRATLELGGRRVTVEQQSGFPREGQSVLTLRLKRPARFAVKVRVPDWATQFAVTAGGRTAKIVDGWAMLPARRWHDGVRIDINFDLQPRLIAGTFGNTGKAALGWGPFVLAYDQGLNMRISTSPAGLGLTAARPPFLLLDNPNELTFETLVATRTPGEMLPARFVTFADAGTHDDTLNGPNRLPEFKDTNRYRIWLRAPGVDAVEGESLLTGGRQNSSRQGNRRDAINDGENDTMSDTFTNQPAAEDWFAVTVDAPVKVKRIVFTHGQCFHDGGWFDTSAGKPRVEVRRTADGDWETVGELAGYPKTTAKQNGPMGGYYLKPGREYALQLEQPVEAVAVRVIGKPACGDRPQQAFASCAELQAFGE